MNYEHLEEDTVEAEFVGATLAIASDTEPLASSREDLNSNPDEVDSSKQPAPSGSTNGAEQGRRAKSASRDQDPSKEFFATRDGAFENAVEASRPVMLRNIDGELQGAWLLTEIDHWDTEKERLVLLTDHSVLSIKYDFITLKVADYRRLLLHEFDKLVIGEFTYPEASVVPKRRSGRGVRAMWNKGKVPQVTDSWNPWSRNIPWITYSSHPLKTQAGQSARHYDVEHFIKALLQAMRLENESKPVNEERCLIEERPIVIENYLGLASLFHNVNNLGFFKSRGRVSF